MITVQHSVTDPIMIPVLFLISGSIGMFVHWAKKALKEEIKSTLIEYIFKDHKKETLYTILGFLGSTMTIWLSGQLDGLTLGQLLLLGGTTGYACDSALNKGAIK